MKHEIKPATLLALATCASIALSDSVNAQENQPAINRNATASSSTNQGTTMPSTVIPVWQDINSRYTPAELFQKIMKLANQAWVTPKEVEDTFGIKFKPPYLDKGRVGYVYVAESDTTEYGRAFKLFHYDGERKYWTLILNGFSAGKSRGECIRFGDALKTILDMGWKEERVPAEFVAYEYWKRTDSMDSRLHIENRTQVKEDDCLRGIQFSNGVKISPPTK